MLRALQSRWGRYATITLVILLLAAVSTLATAQIGPGGAASPGLPFAGMQNAYLSASATWRGRLLPIAQRTFMLLAALEFAVSGIVWILKRESLDELAAKFLLKFTLMSFLLTLITSFSNWLPNIFNGFVYAGEQAVGQPLVTPGDLVILGVKNALGVLKVGLQLASLPTPANLALDALYFLASLMILLSFFAIACVVLLVMLETYVVVFGGGVLFLAFAASRWTAAYAEHLIAHTFYLGVKAFFLYLIVAVGVSTVQYYTSIILTQNLADQLILMFQIGVMTVCLALLTVRVPHTVSWMLMGKTSLGLARVYEKLA